MTIVRVVGRDEEQGSPHGTHSRIEKYEHESASISQARPFPCLKVYLHSFLFHVAELLDPFLISSCGRVHLVKLGCGLARRGDSVWTVSGPIE